MSKVFKFDALPGMRFEINVGGGCRQCVFNPDKPSRLSRNQQIEGCCATNLACTGDNPAAPTRPGNFREVGYNPETDNA